MIEESCAEVVQVLQPSHEQLNEGEKLMCLVSLQSSEATALLSLNPFNDLIMGSILHKPFGVRFDTPMVNGRVKCIALTGFGKQASPIYIDTEKLFSTTSNKHPVPLLEAFLS